MFTARQRTGLAARDCGCCLPGCDRPPYWCEAHHIVLWQCHRGRMNLADEANWKCVHLSRVDLPHVAVKPRQPELLNFS
ncbi:hypothetical protein F1C58_09800 [Glaciihabitans sp. INWT7]|nr:hypothetical protein F1C58_09800 [Glaciihabitans sp. INWT7]